MKKLFALLLSCFIAYEIQSKEIFYFSNDNFNNIPVYFVAPEKIDRNSRLVIVMHGRKRNAEEYRDQWVQKANELNLVIVVPEFAEAKFPGVFQYNYGNVFLQSGEELPQNQTLFSLVEPLANFSLKKFKIESNKWGIYGHGAGAHFVHRYILHQPHANHTLAIAANLGWYLSMTDQEWPFGLAKSNISEDQLKVAFSRYFLLMLGRADTSRKPNSPYVKENWDAISAQGEHRLARGRNFVKSAVAKSKEVNQFFKWGMVEVPTTKGHSNTEQMVPYAAEMFYARLK